MSNCPLFGPPVCRAQRATPLLACAWALASILIAPGAGPGAAQAQEPCAVTTIRFFPARDPQAMKGGKFMGSNEGPTAGFRELAVIKEAPAAGEWQEIPVAKPCPCRYVKYEGPLKLEKNTLLIAAATKVGLADSPVVVAPYRIGMGAAEAGIVRTFHIGNSLTDTVDNWLKPVAESAGRQLDFHRFTIPGAPTDWLWEHPATGFGDNRFLEAFLVLAPIDHIFTQPFAGHGRAVDNEADFSGRFFAACREHSPDVQAWLYVQWPGPKMDDRWSMAKGDDLLPKNLAPATDYTAAVQNHIAYTELVRDKIMETWRGEPILIVPAGMALAELKEQIAAGKVPGMTDFFAAIYADGIHLTPKGRLLVSNVFYGCIYRESPAGATGALNSGLTPEQLAIFQQIAWEAVTGYPPAGVAR